LHSNAVHACIVHAATRFNEITVKAGGMLQNAGESWPLAHSVATVFAFLPLENQWESLPPLPAARAAGAAAVLDGVLHFVGGGKFEPTLKFVEDFSV